MAQAVLKILFLFLAGTGNLNSADRSERVLDFRYEGLYSIRITCASARAKCSSSHLNGIDRMAVVNSRLSTGVWITLASHRDKDIVDRYADVEVAGNANRLIASPGSRFGVDTRFSYVDMEFDPRTGEVWGTLIANDSLADYRIEGRPLATVQQFKHSPPPRVLNPHEMVGKYHGRIGPYSGSMIVRVLPDERVIGHFESDSKLERGVPLLELDFASGEWKGDSGVLLLTLQLSRLAGQGLMALALTQSPPRRLSLEGFQISGFIENEAEFVKVQ